MTQQYLYISQLAQLVGVSIKTVRHYHKMDLLPEPERNESGYRLYDASHVRRLHFIRQMRSIGLSLPQIRAVICTRNYESHLHETLQDVLDEIEQQIHELSERRDRILELLQNAPINYEDLDASPSLYLEKAQDTLGYSYSDLDKKLSEQEAQIDAVLSSYHWSDELPEQFEALMRYFQQHPRQYQMYLQDMQTTWQLLEQDMAGAELDQLAYHFILKHYAVFSKIHNLRHETHLPKHVKQVLQDMLGDVISANQQLFTEHLFKAYHRVSNEKGDM